MLIRGIAGALMEKLSNKLFFYRLDGMRFIAIKSTRCKQSAQECIRQISDIICAEYDKLKISVPRPCSFALMRCDSANLVLSDFLEQIITLIKIAKQDNERLFVEYSRENSEKVLEMSNMLLKLSHDVANHMRNFRIVIQPTISVKDNRIISGEVLLRWKFKGEDVSPNIFIPLMEKENLIQTAGKWVFEQAVSCLAQLKHYAPDFFLSFNLSLKQLAGDGSFAEFMKQILEKYHVDGSCLVAEITESCMDERPEKLSRFMSDCYSMNIRIALDDYGNGYSSLRMLLQYPTDIVKLDRSLLNEVMKSDNKKKFISSIVYACHSFGKEICMEGVETADRTQ